MRAFPARYKGDCAACDAGIVPDQRIFYRDGEPVHKKCPDLADEPVTTAVTCSKCNFTMPCWCDEE